MIIAEYRVENNELSKEKEERRVDLLSVLHP